MSEESKRDINEQIQELEMDFRSKQETGGIASDEVLLEQLNQWYDKYC